MIKRIRFNWNDDLLSPFLSPSGNRFEYNQRMRQYRKKFIYLFCKVVVIGLCDSLFCVRRFVFTDSARQLYIQKGIT